MAKSDQGNDVFLECIEGTPLETSQTPGSEQPETHRSSPATVSGESTNGLDSPQTARDQTIEEKHQAALAEYENKHYVACRDKCMELLRDVNLPSITRCQILQLFASCSYYYGAKHALEQALIIASNVRAGDRVIVRGSTSNPFATRLHNPTTAFIMSLKNDKFPSSESFDAINEALSSDAERKDAIKQGNAIFAFTLKNKAGETESWHIDLKNKGQAAKGLGEKPTVTLSLSDEEFGKLVAGKANAQRLFMSGKLKVKGDVMKATKLEGVMAKARGPKAKL
ncbi:hypothetical protein WAI453_006071 [Rhynchosporium graminicola]